LKIGDNYKLTYDGKETEMPTHYERLFKKGNFRFEQGAWEYLNFDEENLISKASINHFLPIKEGIHLKYEKYYKRNFSKVSILENFSPSKVEGFKKWKAYNPQRDNYE